MSEHEMTVEESEFGPLVRAVCTCGHYRSGWTSEPKARRAWRDHKTSAS